MKKFEFKLQRLLEIREKKEESQKAELAKASGAYQIELNKKLKILDNIDQARKKLTENKKALTLDQLKAYDQLSVSGDLSIRALEPVIEQKRLRMEKEIERYTELKKERRTVEILKEKAHARWKAEADMEEVKVQDEIGKDQFLKRKEEERLTDNIMDNRPGGTHD